MTDTNCWSCTADYSKDMPKPGESGGAGYALIGAPTGGGQVRICYSCAAEREKSDMLATGRATLYLTGEPRPIPANKLGTMPPLNHLSDMRVSNWTGRISIPVMHRKRGRHNVAGTRTDVWFLFEGAQWHGVLYGENTQILHCRRLKSRPISY